MTAAHGAPAPIAVIIPPIPIPLEPVSLLDLQAALDEPTSDPSGRLALLRIIDGLWVRTLCGMTAVAITLAILGWINSLARVSRELGP